MEMNSLVLACIRHFFMFISQSPDLLKSNENMIKNLLDSLSEILLQCNQGKMDYFKVGRSSSIQIENEMRLMFSAIENLYHSFTHANAKLIAVLLNLAADKKSVFTFDLLPVLVTIFSSCKLNFMPFESTLKTLFSNLLKSKLSFQQRNLTFMLISSVLRYDTISILMDEKKGNDEGMKRLALLTHAVCAETRVILDSLDSDQQSYKIAILEDDEREHLSVSRTVLPALLDTLTVILGYLVGLEEKKNVNLDVNLILSIQTALEETMNGIEGYLIDQWVDFFIVLFECVLILSFSYYLIDNLYICLYTLLLIFLMIISLKFLLFITSSKRSSFVILYKYDVFIGHIPAPELRFRGGHVSKP